MTQIDCVDAVLPKQCKIAKSVCRFKLVSILIALPSWMKLDEIVGLGSAFNDSFHMLAPSAK